MTSPSPYNIGTILPSPPKPQAEFSAEYANQLYRWMESLSAYATGVHLLSGNGLFLPAIPTTGYGLKPGEVFANAGVLTVVRTGDIWAGALYATTGLGSVTVTVA